MKIPPTRAGRARSDRCAGAIRVAQISTDPGERESVRPSGAGEGDCDYQRSKAEALPGGLVVERERSTHGMLETDVHIALARRRGELAVRWDLLTLERLAERASTRRDLYISLDLPGTHAGKAEAVGERRALVQLSGTHEYGPRAALLAHAPSLVLSRN